MRVFSALSVSRDVVRARGRCIARIERRCEERTRTSSTVFGRRRSISSEVPIVRASQRLFFSPSSRRPPPLSYRRHRHVGMYELDEQVLLSNCTLQSGLKASSSNSKRPSLASPEDASIRDYSALSPSIPICVRSVGWMRGRKSVDFAVGIMGVSSASFRCDRC